MSVCILAKRMHIYIYICLCIYLNSFIYVFIQVIVIDVYVCVCVPFILVLRVVGGPEPIFRTDPRLEKPAKKQKPPNLWAQGLGFRV